MSFCLVSLFSIAAGAKVAVAAAAPPPPHFECAHRTGAPIMIDGVPDEQAWRDCAPITDFRLFKTLGKPTEKTTLRICYDETYLYALFECTDPDIYVLHQERDGKLWESDAVELFFWPDDSNPIYYEFEVGPANAVFDARFVNTGSGDFQRWAQWNCEIRTATRVRGTVNDWKDRDDGYTVEIAIPLKAFAETTWDKPLPGQTWKFAAVRVDLSATLAKEERAATANVPDGDIHQKDGYATLTFK